MKKLLICSLCYFFTPVYILAKDQIIIESAQKAVKTELLKRASIKEGMCISAAQASLLIKEKISKDNLSMCGEFSSDIKFGDAKVYSMAVCGKVFGKDIINNPIESDYIYQRAQKYFYFNYKGKKSFYYDHKSTKASIQYSDDSMFNAMQNKYCK
ncbi:TPA: hypothetical protein SIC75_002122 [Pasteurella multocida]|uniref:hypothetical protein n=1 Tax=Pasteurella multocida TaxID=747 RepID=UPI000353836D|nr:hypothetical protein [Pasteurella multocida]AON58441.1 hypothetical protein AZI96_06770 [Pasteurella multocida]AUK28636.1 hypothetical protein A4205_08160 [Pasteurella multocida]AUK33873.1 hypothetical protein A4201_02920 [Pasteurella multocida]AUK48433.1 hypothetical protein A4210_01165 [Pasteurella multocida]AUK53039.1 hypothetical protein A4204_01170 [Pasteurella multocida]